MSTATLTRETASAALARIARQGNILDFVIGTTDDGCPILAENAPDVCENVGFGEPEFPTLIGHERCEVVDGEFAHMTHAPASWVAAEAARGARLRRISERKFQLVGGA